MVPLLNFLEPDDEVEDAEEECFILFSSKPDNRDLGFVSRTETTVSVAVNNQDFTIHQSPSLLTSTRDAGTTGAVLWKVTPLLASWLTHPANKFAKELFNQSSTVVELGAGTSGVLALSLSAVVGKYITTDQEYCLKLLRQNISENYRESKRSIKSKTKSRNKKKTDSSLPVSNITVMPLDWQLTEVSSLSELKENDIDLIIAADCIYNESLVDPLVDTMAEICKLTGAGQEDCELTEPGQISERKTLVLVAQELRSPEVLEAFMKAFYKKFRVWRLPDKILKDCGDGGQGLVEGGGYVVHIGALR